MWDPETKSLKQARDESGNLVYYDETERTIDDVWRLAYLMPANKTENVRYETQKPLTVARRVIEATTNPGDLIADFFCGSGTALVAAEELGGSGSVPASAGSRFTRHANDCSMSRTASRLRSRTSAPTSASAGKSPPATASCALT